MTKKTFIFHLDRTQYMEEMTPTEKLMLYEAITNYNSWQEVVVEWSIRFVWSRIKREIDYDHEQYKKTIERNTLNGKKWWRPRKDGSTIDKKPPKTTGFSENPPNQLKAKKAERDNHNHTDYDTNIILEEKKIKNKKEEIKEKYKDFVFLSALEFQSLKELLGEWNLENYIEALNNYLGQKGKNIYKSHYFTIRNWRNRDKKSEKLKKPPPEIYSSDARNLTS